MIAQNITHIKERIACAAKKAGRNSDEIKLVAVSKKFPAKSLQEAIDAGHSLFGENYIQEVVEKKGILGNTAHIHFIGNLQSNKARFAAEYCTMVETVDRVKIASALNKHLEELNRDLDVLIQVNIGEDKNKSGTTKEDAIALIKAVQELPRLKIRGLMTIPPFNEDAEETRVHFANLRRLAEQLQEEGILACEGKIELSMGMSGDFEVAIEEGATIVRVGTAIFGSRYTS